MTNQHSPPDDPLLEELAAALQEADPVPDHVLEAARASFTWRTIDAELAELAFDSAIDEMAGVRSSGGGRQLTFRSRPLEIEVVVDHAHGHLIGQLVPPQRAVVELVGEAATLRAETDEHGAFRFDELPPGPVSLRCSIAQGAATITTDWLVL